VLLERRGLAFRRAVASFAEASHIPVLSFAGKRDKGRPGVLAESPWPERKIDKVMPLMRKAAATGRSQVVAIGVAQEYQRVFTGTRDQTPTGAVWFSYNRTGRRVTCYYFYVWDEALGPAFIKICAYFPYPGKIWVLWRLPHKTHYAAARVMPEAVVGVARVLVGALCERTAAT